MAEKRLKASIIIGGLLDGSLRDALASTKNGFRQIGDAMRNARREQSHLKQEIASLESSGHSVDAVTRRYNTLTSSIERARLSQDRLRRAEARRGQAERISGRLQSGAVRIGAVAAAGIVPVVSGVRAAQEMQTETARVEGLGLGEKATREALDFARTVRGYGTSQVAAVELMRDALAAFGNVEDARNAIPTLEKIRFGNQALYGSERGGENTRQFMDMLRVIDSRGGATSQAEFARQSDHIQRVISATGNRVTPEQWRDYAQHSGIAGKSMSNDAFYYQSMPLINDMGSGATVGTGIASLYNDLFQGHTTVRAARNLDRLHLIGDRTKVRYDKAGQTAQFNPGALLGADEFQKSPFDWMRHVLIPTLAKDGITDPKKIVETIGSIVTNRTGAAVLANMVLLRTQIERDENLASHAHGIDETYQAGQRTTTGQQIGAHSQVDDLRLRLGIQLLPIYTRALLVANDALARLNSFTERHPKLARDLALGVAAGTAALLVAAPAMIAAGVALNAYSGFSLLAARREAMLTAATLANTTATEAATVAQTEAGAASAVSMMRFGGWRRVLRASSAPFRSVAAGFRSVVAWLGPFDTILERGALQMGLFAGALQRVGAGRLALRGVLLALEPIGAVLSTLASPVVLAIGATVAAVVFGASLIIRHWGQVKAYFGGVWSGLSDGVAPAIGQVLAAFRPLGAMLKSAGQWVLSLFSPMKAAPGDFASAQAAGVRFGQSLASVLSGALVVIGKIISGLTWLIQNGSHAVSWAGSAAARGVNWAARNLNLITVGQNETPASAAAQATNAHDPASLPEIPEVTNNNRQTITNEGDTHHHTYNIHQQPGESSDDLARRIQQTQQRNERTRSTLFDQAD
ncbi:phage tail tape measure protein [Gluconobacter oxydans]|uniref:hypothetical protein n=1 Tax=Gluconobacter oxydans TaxID=442 RepID=UPI0026497785|nr:hypothetical protein [Gluconobacter oxydans]WKE49033.1 hypothetical protein NUJ38_04785 [Gluconobacter oxydans]